MAKRKGGPKRKARGTGRKRAGGRKSVSRPSSRKTSAGRARGARPAVKKKAAARGTKKATPRKSARSRGTASGAGRTKSPRLNRARRQLEEMVPTPPSSLDLKRRGTAARTGRAEMAEDLLENPGITPALTGGDVDADWQSAYSTGDEAPGGDNPTPDQDVVDEIGKSLGVEYQDNEELKASDKVAERDKHRWELDPASSEDYKERD